MIQRKPITIEQATVWVEDLCSRAEYAPAEINDRLIRKGLSRADAAKIVRHLEESNFLNINRFAEAFVRDKVMFSGWGRRKIAAALSQKRVPREIIEEALEELDIQTYRQNLNAILESKLRSLQKKRALESNDESEGTKIDYETKAALYRFAISRGYESEAISKAISKLESAPRD